MGLHSVPPPPASDPGKPGPARVRKPQLAERAPELLAQRLRAAGKLDAYFRARGITTSELAEVWRCTEAAVRDMRTGERPFPVGHLMALPLRHARATLDLLLTALGESAAA